MLKPSPCHQKVFPYIRPVTHQLRVAQAWAGSKISLQPEIYIIIIAIISLTSFQNKGSTREEIKVPKFIFLCLDIARGINQGFVS